MLSRTEDFPELCNTGEMKLSANHMKQKISVKFQNLADSQIGLHYASKEYPFLLLITILSEHLQNSMSRNYIDNACWLSKKSPSPSQFQVQNHPWGTLILQKFNPDIRLD